VSKFKQAWLEEGPMKQLPGDYLHYSEAQCLETARKLELRCPLSIGCRTCCELPPKCTK